MDSVDGNASQLSDWTLEKIITGVEDNTKNVKFRLRIGFNSIGRHSASDLRINSALVSRHHAEIIIPGNLRAPIQLRDLNSINGTSINQVICRANTINLYEGDIISFGAQYDENDDEEEASKLPIYVIKFRPLNNLPSPPSSFPSPHRAPPVVDIIDQIVISDDEEDADEKLDVKPIVSTIKPAERIANNILSIFGNADETILSGLQRINPIVCEAVKQTSNAEVVVLSSDDEDSEDTSEKLKGTTATSSIDVNKPVEDAEQEMYDSESEESNLIYSQALLNEMKSEMVDESGESDNQSGNEEKGYTTSKPELSSPPIISLFDDDDGDDGDGNEGNGDDSDEDLNIKVSNWKNLLLCSQIFPKMNCSQALMADTTSNGYSSNDEFLTPMSTKETGVVSENSLIQNLFQPLEEKLDTSDNENSKKRKLKEKPSNAEDIINSPVVKTKKRRVMLVLDSDESNDSDNNDDERLKLDCPLPIELKTKQSPCEKSPTIITSTKPKEKITNRRPMIISPPHLKYGRKISNSLSSKANHSGFLQKKRLKKPDPKLKELRKERLKTISSNKSNKTDENYEMNTTNRQKESKDKEHKGGTSKVKNTIQNRGAFLCEIDEMSTSVAANKKDKPNNASKQVTIKTKNDDSLPKVVPLNFFAQEPSTLNKCLYEVKKVIRKNAEQARNRNAPKKIRFADVEKGYEQQLKIEERTKVLTSKLNSNATTQIAVASTTQATIISSSHVDIPAPDISMPDRDNAADVAKKPKKTVRFNDVPTIYYFESYCEFSRKVDRKDLMPHLSYRQRRSLIRRSFPTVDETNNIISLILTYSNEWLSKLSPGTYPIAQKMELFQTTFESFEHYKRIIFSLMKLEYMSTLEREIEINAKAKPSNFILDDIIENKERIILITKCAINENGKQTHCKKMDLVLLKIGDRKTKVFGYMTYSRKFGTFGDHGKYYFEIMPNSIDVVYLRKSKFISIQPAIDNLQVTIGAYNAIYQFEFNPLLEMLLKPPLLLSASNAQLTHLNDDIAPEVKRDNLNVEQLNAVKEIYKKICFNKTETTPNVSLIQGPPGTGKSVVVNNLALQVLYGSGGKFRDKKILICAQSNCAIDSVASKLYEARSRISDKKNRFSLFRFGIFEKMHSKVHPLSLHNLLEFERVKKLCHTLNEKFVSVSIWKNNLQMLEAEIKTLQQQGQTNNEKQKKLDEKKREIDMLHASYKNALTAEEEHNICKKYLTQCNIVCTTLSSCVKLFQWIDYFDVCIIDEATQCTEPWTLLPLKFGISSLVLVGDCQQLPATVLSKQAAEYGLTRSLFTRIENSIKDDSIVSNEKRDESNVIFCLRVQYRMHPEICMFPNSFFYKNTLVNAENTLENTISLKPYSVFNLVYAQNESSGQGKIINQLEADFVVKLLIALNEYIPIENNTYGVITPYANQRKILADAVQNAHLPHVSVKTIDSYQGTEKDVIVISNARTSGVGFLANPQRLNVAITRPKKCLIICGNFRNLEFVPAWRCLLQDAKQRNVYYEISASDKSDIKKKVIQRILPKK